MVPDGSLEWQRDRYIGSTAMMYDCYYAEGHGDIAPSMIVYANKLSQKNVPYWHKVGKIIGGGAEGTVFDYGRDVALKAYRLSTNEESRNRSVGKVLANVALWHAIGQHPYEGETYGWSITAATPHALLVPRSEGAGPVLFAMERVRGRSFAEGERPVTLPSPQELRDYYDAALDVTGVNTNDYAISYDAHTDNAIISMADRRHTQIDVTVGNFRPPRVRLPIANVPHSFRLLG